MYIKNAELLHSESCRPCGVIYDACAAASLLAGVLLEEDNVKFSTGGKFNCRIDAPHLWPGEMFVQHRIPLPLVLETSEKRRINILMTGIGQDFTGGPLSIMHFANELIRAGHNVRWLNVDGSGLQRSEFFTQVSKYNFLELFHDKAEFIFDAANMNLVEQKLNRFHPEDIFVATLYFTSQLAHFTINEYSFRQRNFIYFIQDFEPIFFPHDAQYIEALESYRFPHFPIFSSPFLERWFEQEKLSIFQYLESDKAKQMSFAAYPAIRAWPVLNMEAFSEPNRQRILIAYARSHADRNAYELMIDTLSMAVCEDIFNGNWRFIGVGAIKSYNLTIGAYCGKSVLFEIFQNIPEPEYFEIIRHGDVGLSIMISPHPSLPPFDFASAGLITVTNSFKTKTADVFHDVSTNFVVAEPFVDSLVQALKVAVAQSTNIDSRIQGMQRFNWERSWKGDRCYGKVLLKKISAWRLHFDTLW